MSLPIFQRTIVDGQGNVVNGATVEVRRESDNALALIYSDRAGTIIRANPFFTDASGLAQFYVAQGEYRITATIGGDQITWRWVIIGVPSVTVPNASESVAGIVELATGAEVAVGSDNTRAVTPFSLLSRGATEDQSGLVQLAKIGEAQAGVSDNRALSPARMKDAQIRLGTAVTASGTAVNFTGIPSWAKRIVVLFAGLSGSGTSDIIVQLGDSGGVETTGYTGSTTSFVAGQLGGANITTGLGLARNASAANAYDGSIEIMRIQGNQWVSRAVGANTNNVNIVLAAGSKTLSDVLDRVRVTHVNGTDTFDAGTINISWE